MAILLNDNGYKYVLNWNPTTTNLELLKYGLTTFDYPSGEYLKTLIDTTIIGGSGYIRPYGNMFDFSSGSTTTVTEDIWVKLNTSTTSLFTSGFTHSNNRLTYVGSGTQIIKMEGISSVSSGSNNVIHFSFYKNGSIIPCSEQDVTIGSSGRANACPFHCVTTMVDGDYIEVWVKNGSSSTSIVLQHVNVILSTL